MFCVIALIVFSVLGIFSATHRSLARQALACVFKRVTFRPCDTDFKEKIKNKILAKLLNRSALVARLFNKHFELLAWIFFILMIVSTFYVIKGGYNFYLYGSCNGLNQSGFCAFDPGGENNKITQINSPGSCGPEQSNEKSLTLAGVDLSGFPRINAGSKNTIVFIGCYKCDYSRKAWPEIRRLAGKEKTNLIFAHYPAIADTNYLSDLAYCAYGRNQQQFWSLNDYLFAADKTKLSDRAFINQALTNFGFKPDEINKCAAGAEIKTAREQRFQELKKTKLYGTPTIFINGQVFVGPKPYRVYRGELKKFIFF